MILYRWKGEISDVLKNKGYWISPLCPCLFVLIRRWKYWIIKDCNQIFSVVSQVLLFFHFVVTLQWNSHMVFTDVCQIKEPFLKVTRKDFAVKFYLVLLKILIWQLILFCITNFYLGIKNLVCKSVFFSCKTFAFFLHYCHYSNGFTITTKYWFPGSFPDFQVTFLWHHKNQKLLSLSIIFW